MGAVSPMPTIACTKARRVRRPSETSWINRRSVRSTLMRDGPSCGPNLNSLPVRRSQEPCPQPLPAGDPIPKWTPESRRLQPRARRGSTGAGTSSRRLQRADLARILDRRREGPRGAGGERHLEVLEGQGQAVTPRLHVGFLARPAAHEGHRALLRRDGGERLHLARARRSGAPPPCPAARAECLPRPRPTRRPRVTATSAHQSEWERLNSSPAGSPSRAGLPSGRAHEAKRLGRAPHVPGEDAAQRRAPREIALAVARGAEAAGALALLIGQARVEGEPRRDQGVEVDSPDVHVRPPRAGAARPRRPSEAARSCGERPLEALAEPRAGGPDVPGDRAQVVARHRRATPHAGQMDAQPRAGRGSASSSERRTRMRPP